MAFDTDTRNELSKMVSDARALLRDEFTQQLQEIYGIQPNGKITTLDKLNHLVDEQYDAARVFRERLAHLKSGISGEKKPIKAAIDRMTREQSFTVLNRFAALRMCEERGLLQQCVGEGLNSRGFQVYLKTAGSALGSHYERYRTFIFSVFDEIAVDLGILFDRFSPLGLLFPRETALNDLLEIINRKDLKHIWSEDEAIGWIYQYFNSAEERKAMRKASQAPRNSRELAVRNQFFTPRYVVEFLTDNTLGRIWYEMCQGDTSLLKDCHYLVRRPDEVFINIADGPLFDWFTGAESASEPIVHEITHAVNGYPRTGDQQEGTKVWFNEKLNKLSEENIEAFKTQELLDFLFVSYQADSFAEDLAEKHKAKIGQVLAELRRRQEKANRDNLTQEEILNLPEFIPLRPKKDPRDLKILDPACGSGHFLLYAFDLLETIYQEGWKNECSPPSEATGRTLREDYETIHDLHRKIPELIVSWNLHGIEIDPRAIQIATLALWLRAQRSWQNQGVKAVDRPMLTKSNLVCAEPMPGDENMLKEFTDELKPKVLGQLVEVVFDKMKMAGDAGSLLKIEEDIKDAVSEARRQWEAKPKQEQAGLFPEIDKPKPKQQNLRFNVSDIDDIQFWDRVEAQILKALKEYSEHVENGISVRHRLFADDTAQGFAFIDLCQKRYDVVLMNPPFGDSPKNVTQLLKNLYHLGRPDAYMCFMFRIAGLSNNRGKCGCITSRTFQNLQFFEPLRRSLLGGEMPLLLMADLAGGVLDGATVETCATVFGNSCKKSFSTKEAIFFNAVNADERDNVILDQIRMIGSGLNNDKTFIRRRSWFEELPGAVICYSLHEAAFRAFGQFPPINYLQAWSKKKGNLPTYADVLQGLIPGDLFRFVRLLTELPNDKISDGSWLRLCRGGEYKRFWADEPCAVNWVMSGKEIMQFAADNYGSASRTIKNVEHFGQQGLSYPRISSIGLNVRVMPRNFAFSDAGLAVIPHDQKYSLNLAAFLNSRIADYFANSLHPGRKFEIAHISSLPIPDAILSDQNIKQLAREAIQFAQSFDVSKEDSNLFTVQIIAELCPEGLRHATENLNQNLFMQLKKYSSLLHEINQIISEHYGFTESEYISMSALYRDSGRYLSEIKRPSEFYLYRRALEIWPEESEVLDLTNLVESSSEIASLFSYFVGCIFGRWDLRLAIDTSLAPNLPDPLDPLPVCPPGMLIGQDGLPAKKDRIVSEEWLRARTEANNLPPDSSVKKPFITDAEYPLCISWDGILVDDPGLGGIQPHRADIIRRVLEALDVLWMDKAHEIEQEACDILNISDLRDYFRKPSGFFQDHLKRYSKSRRKAPIYWPLSTASGSYTLWVYYHRLTDQTLYTCINEFVEPKINEVSRDIERLQKEPRDGRNAKQLSQLETLMDFRQELSDFKDELLLSAKLPYKPNLIDGAVITAAPLWKLFLYKPWQNNLKDCWKKLEAGDYDWAYLAYSIWPDRVREKCKTDRSLAISHGLEELYEEKRVNKGNKRKKG